MRDIKFRYVYKHETTGFIKTIEATLTQIEESTDPAGPFRDVSNWIDDGYELLENDRNTGLKDKNGKEIYEGDILFHSAESGSLSVQAYGFERKWGRGEKFIVSYLDCGLVLRHISAFGNSGYDTPNCIIKGWPIVDAYQFWNLQRGFEVAGNIYEEVNTNESESSIKHHTDEQQEEKEADKG